MPDMPVTLPDAILVGAILALCIALVALWRRGAGMQARCDGLIADIAVREARLRDAATRSEADRDRIARLDRDTAGLSADLRGLEARLKDAAAERDRAAREAAEARTRVEDALATARKRNDDLGRENEGLKRDMAARAQAHEKEVALLKELREDMTGRFAALADELLKTNGETFGKTNRERMEALLAPMREQVDHFQRELREAHTHAAKDRERLKTEIEQLSRRSEQVSQEAVALTRALKGEKQKQGAWGEMVLERLLEDSGLTRGREYETQFHVADPDGGRRRPDVVVRLPAGKCVVIDVKVSLVAYEAAVNAPDEDERSRQLRAHVAAVRAHIDALAARDYAAMVDGSVDYVLMFMPVEGALAAALELQGDLTAYAIAKRVGIATPTTLMMALRTIQHVWAVENRQRNAEEIARRAGHLHDKMAGVIEAFDKVGTHLGRAQEEHTKALDRMARGSGNVLGQFDKLRRLGARTNKEMAVGFDPEDDDAEDGDDDTPPRAIPARTEAAE